MNEPPGLGREVEELAALARRFSDAGRFEEGADLLLLAIRVDPRSFSAKLALAEIRKLQQQQGKGGGTRSLRDMLREPVRRSAIDAAHFLGLSHLYAER